MAPFESELKSSFERIFLADYLPPGSYSEPSLLFTATSLTDLNFTPVTKGERGRAMVIGEYTSMITICSVVPNLVPKPLAWGAYGSLPETYFFLSQFKPMSYDLPLDVDGRGEIHLPAR
ncbi:hypothetical protein B0T21DRAFT_409907 [Apiosordaria backusii]|uniref:Uncharacterized protein n=1 Tax=Apiosordaria backusii TaxID=314023 RepID=A0AA40BSG0_9PEZI|nr:hypothetical protein B0T21DRAFT_409907 [Apiosordaria backusii]